MMTVSMDDMGTLAGNGEGYLFETASQHPPPCPAMQET